MDTKATAQAQGANIGSKVIRATQFILEDETGDPLCLAGRAQGRVRAGSERRERRGPRLAGRGQGRAGAGPARRERQAPRNAEREQGRADAVPARREWQGDPVSTIRGDPTLHYKWNKYNGG